MTVRYYLGTYLCYIAKRPPLRGVITQQKESNATSDSANVGSGATWVLYYYCVAGEHLHLIMEPSTY